MQKFCIISIEQSLLLEQGMYSLVAGEGGDTCISFDSRQQSIV